MKTVLITGATGDVGTHLARELAGKYKLRLSDKRPLKAKNFVKADISKMAEAMRACTREDEIRNRMSSGTATIRVSVSPMGRFTRLHRRA